MKDSTIAAELICDSVPFWMQLSLLDECRIRVIGVLDKLSNSGTFHASLEMRLQRALGAASAWSQGPTQQVQKSWVKTLELARQLGNSEHQMQGHYGLWLYYLRSGDYEKSLNHAEQLSLLGKSCGDEAAGWTGERAKGVSQHFLGDHNKAKQTIEGVLAGHDYSQDRSFPLRFGVDQRIAGLAFLARVLWLLGDKLGAKEAAESAMSEANELDHVSSLCCALLEGGCALWAIAEEWEKVIATGESAIKIAKRYGLGFWKTYAEAFVALGNANLKPSASTLRILQAATLSLTRLGVHPGYSVFVAGIARLQLQLQNYKGALQTTDELIKLIASDHHWGLKNFIQLRDRLKAH